MVTYVHPFNERIRTLLRLEELFRRFERFAGRTEAPDHHVALTTLFDILEVSSRADVKSDLLQELERQRQTLLAFKNNPGVSTDALERILGEIEAASAQLQAAPAKTGTHLRENEWLMGVRSRSVIPGCSLQVDLPFYYAWQQSGVEMRQRDILEWAQPFKPLQDCLNIVLRLLRESAQRSRESTQTGTYQQQLGGKVYHLAQIRIDERLGAVPEFSANKYMLWIRFGRLDREFKTRPFEGNVDFELSLCSL
jgi:cell division protein ZapD